MKKSELEAERDQYIAGMHRATVAEEAGLYEQAISAAMSVFPHIDGMLQYESKFEQNREVGIAAIDLVLKYAPLLLHFKAIRAAEELVVSCKRIGRSSKSNVAEQVKIARGRLSGNHRLWNYIERDVRASQDELNHKIGGEQTYWRATVDAWVQMEMVNRSAEGREYFLCLATRLTDVTRAKCPTCGAIVASSKSTLLQEAACPKCRSKVSFVLLGPVTSH